MAARARTLARRRPAWLARHGHWGIGAAEAERAHPGDRLVPAPLWGWTHAVEIEAPAEAVWPWVAQIGADRGGFYSYQWLENLFGCRLRNADAIHPEWELRQGDGLLLHPRQPALPVVEVARERHLVAHAAPDERAGRGGGRWVAASWLFLVEPLEPSRSRLVSRYRCACSPDLLTRLAFGPALLAPIGFAMDRRMLLGVKRRAERHHRPAPRPPRAEAPA